MEAARPIMRIKWSEIFEGMQIHEKILLGCVWETHKYNRLVCDDSIYQSIQSIYFYGATVPVLKKNKTAV